MDLSSFSSSETTRLVYQSDTTAIYQKKNEGVKVLIDPNPTEEQLSRLAHEQIISRFLPSTCRKREVVDVKGFDGSIHFKWVEGITLEQWIQQAQSRPEVSFSVRIRVAIAIVETLIDFHDGEVAYNNLSSSNIIVDLVDDCYVATFIDLSRAIIFYNRDASTVRKAKGVDFLDLGAVLNELFSGEQIPLEVLLSDAFDRKLAKRGKQQSLGDGVPIYLGAVVSTLMTRDVENDMGTPERYESANQVLFDLNLCLNKSDVYLRSLDMDALITHGRLQLPVDVFYGRQSEMSMLLHALNSVLQLGGQPIVVLVSGCPGTGKTSLLKQIEKPLHKSNGHLICGKFDLRTRPDCVLFSALDSFYDNIVKEGKTGDILKMRRRINDVVGAGCGVLAKSIPALETLMGREYDQSHEDVPGPNSFEQRWKVLLCKLIAATSSRERPLALLFDDLQWADETTLSVVAMMTSDPDIKHCLFLGSYRDNEVVSNHRVKKMVQSVQEQGISVMTMTIGPIEKDCVNTLVSEALCLPPRICQPLSTVIHSKTGGLALFVVNFLRSLNEEGLLRFNLNSKRWEFDVNQVRLKEISQGVVHHMSQRMTRLPREMQMGLKLASCLGSTFESRILEKSIKNEPNLDEFLMFAVEGGFIHEIAAGSYCWAHDQVQQAAYELIPENKRESFHVLLGSRLFLKTPSEELSEFVFTIVANMNVGLRLIRSQQQKNEVARLNLLAGEKAIYSAAFDSAAKYLLAGISLLSEDCWDDDDQYNLTIKLYDAASEALYVSGDFSSLSSIIQEPILRARSFEDKLNIYHNFIRYLSASSKFQEAIAKCISVLSQLGETVPLHVDNDVYMSEAQSVKQLLQNKTETELLALPTMTDEHMLAVMQFLNHAVLSAYHAEPLLSPILVFRMVKLSIQHGVCKISAFAFGLYGGWLVTEQVSDFDGGYRMGHVAVELMLRLGAEELLPRVYASVYSFINVWKEPIQAILPMHLEGYDKGIQTGDVEYSMSHLYIHSMLALYGCGELVSTLDEKISLYVKRALQCSQKNIAKFLVIAHDLVQRLLGSNKSSYMIFLDCSEESLLKDSVQNNFVWDIRCILTKKKYFSFLVGDMDTAAEMLELGLEYPNGQNGRFFLVLVGVVIDGLIAFYFARKHSEEKERWVKMGEDAMDKVQNWAVSSNWNFINKLLLLEAEYHFMKGNKEKALAKYDASIQAAKDHRFVHEEGLAYEKKACFLLNRGKNCEALVCLAEAKKCYAHWGAQRLVDRIETIIVQLIDVR